MVVFPPPSAACRRDSRRSWSRATQVNPPPLAEGRKKLSVLLVVSTFIGHQFLLIALGEELVRRGHRVAMLGPVKEGSSFPLPRLPESVGIEFIETAKIEPDSMRQMSKFAGNITSFAHFLFKGQQHVEQSKIKNVAALTRRIVEQMNTSEWDYAVVDITCASVHTIFQLWGPDKDMISCSPLPLLVPLPPWPSPVGMSWLTDNMSFLYRLINSLVQLLPTHTKLMRRQFPGQL